MKKKNKFQEQQELLRMLLDYQEKWKQAKTSEEKMKYKQEICLIHRKLQGFE